MSINHYSSDTPQTSSLWWTQQQYQPTTFLNSHISNSINPCFNLNNNQVINDDDDDNSTHPPLDDDQATPITAATPEEEEEEEEEDHHDEEKEGMFEKALTPSDVGKLNRLVIPKQHAEKYFPLGGDSVESKGLLLSFEDESGKCWRFRYSYWNSSQSYVLTKGWSRYVKDKRLDAGDVVLFQRHRAHANRLFIRWRRRQPTTTGSTAAAHISQSNTSGDGNGNGNGNGVGGVPVGWPRGFYSTHPYPMHHHPFAYQPADSFHAGGGSQGQNQTTPVGNGSSSRVLRLFGVNMECQPDNDSETLRPECSYNIMSSTQGTPTHHFYHHQPS